MKPAAFFALALALTGCMGSTDAPPPLPLTAEERMTDPACTGTWVAGVRGRVLDEVGAPVAEADVQMCLRLEGHVQRCLEPAPTDANGWFAIVTPDDARCLTHAVVRATRNGADQRYGISFQEISLSPVYAVIDVPAPMELVSLTTSADMPPMGDPASVRTVRFPSGVELDVTPSDLDFADSYSFLAATEVPLSRAPEFVTAVPGVLGLVAFGPELGASPGIPFRLPERTGLAAGTPVELFVVGGIYTELSSGHVVEEGRFESFGTGRVEAGQVVPDAGSELPYLTWVGYRAAR
ncbi:MAG: hypothetical protein AB8I08_12595 [Sandaracinaceae bacterium]